MAGLTHEQIAAVFAACTGNASVLADSLKFCFDQRFRLEVGTQQAWNIGELTARFGGPGLILGLEVGQEGFLCLVPESLPLPAWYAHPGLSEISRLDSLAQEWSINVLPEELTASNSFAVASGDLTESVLNAVPVDGARTVELLASPASEESSAPSATILIIGPVSHLQRVATQQATPHDPGASSAAPPPQTQAVLADRRTRRLFKIPVTVTVRLAEKPIEMAQLMGLTPGSLITFSKSCEDLVDLYVNNRHFGRGETVKVGEKFGMRISEVTAGKPVAPPTS